MYTKPKDIIRNALLNEIALRLEEITSEQRELFQRIYPDYPEKKEKITVENLSTAIDLIHRTLIKNKALNNR